jgi:hemerythrin-like domain-containing protein
MPIKLGARPDHGFDQPLGLLSDCHRRIERFLDSMIRVLDETGGGALSQAQRDGLEKALAYFATAAPRHTADEEQSLFPRLRQSADPAVAQALAKLDALEADHREAEAGHWAVDRLCRRWLEGKSLPAPEAKRLGELLHGLREMYRRHIAVEDRELFPLAGRVLSPAELAEVGADMARRRGLEAARMPSTSLDSKAQEDPA